MKDSKTLSVPLRLDGLDGNAFALLGAFKKAAKRAGYTDADVAPVLDDAKSGDYDHLLRVLMANTTDTSDNDDADDSF